MATRSLGRPTFHGKSGISVIDYSTCDQDLLRNITSFIVKEPNILCNSRQFDVNSTFYSTRSTTLSTPFEYNTVQEILTNKQVSLSVTLKTAEISVMFP